MSIIQLYSGTMFDLAAPDPSLITIADIAHSLARLCRYTGHSRTFASVAEHSVHVSLVVPPEYAREGLMHDAAEAYVGDVASPLKRMIAAYYEPIEQAVNRAVVDRFGLVHYYRARPAVRTADLRMLGIEARALMQPTLEAARPFWGDIVDVEMHGAIDRIGRKPEEAERMFLDRCEELGIR